MEMNEFKTHTIILFGCLFTIGIFVTVMCPAFGVLIMDTQTKIGIIDEVDYFLPGHAESPVTILTFDNGDTMVFQGLKSNIPIKQKVIIQYKEFGNIRILRKIEKI